MSVNWPTRMDYGNAIQNPKNCFKDPALKSGRVKTNQLGLPIGASGAYATVYELEAGSKKYAVRCFTLPISNQGRRYDVLSKFLHDTQIDSLVEFSYLDEGIRIKGCWYPVLRMKWISGLLFTDYVRKNLKNQRKLKQLAEDFKKVVSDLNSSGIAHGDLQHGNIIVQNNGAIRLVDYDSFFIPSLKNNPPNEVGHPNYQHPKRIQTGCYHEHIDNFPALVIYLSLIALIEEPGLWKKFNDGGDNLIFSSDDFKNPGKTLVWKVLRRLPDKKVRRLAEKLELFCQKPVKKTPQLETLLQKKIKQSPPPPPVFIPQPPKHEFEFKQPLSHKEFKLPPLPKTSFIDAVIKERHSKPVSLKRADGKAITCSCGYVNKKGEIYCQKCVRTLMTGNSWCSSCESPAPIRASYCPRCGIKQM